MSVSKKGYSDKSPYKNRKSLLINSPQGLIDMNNTGRFLMGIDETGFSKLLLPYSGLHQFPGKKITELPLAQQGIIKSFEDITGIKPIKSLNNVTDNTKNVINIDVVKEDPKTNKNVTVYATKDKTTSDYINTLTHKSFKRNYPLVPGVNVPDVNKFEEFNSDYYEDTWQAWLKNGKPSIVPLTGRNAIEGRSFFIPTSNWLQKAIKKSGTNEMNLNYRSDNNYSIRNAYLAELAHAQQELKGIRSKDREKWSTPDEYDLKAYNTPGAHEYNAHEVIQPKLENRYSDRHSLISPNTMDSLIKANYYPKHGEFTKKDEEEYITKKYFNISSPKYQQGGQLLKAQQGKLFPDFTSNYDFGPVNPNSQLKQSNIPISTTSPKVDPYVNIINKDTKARQAEYRKDLGKRALMSAGASAAIVTGGAALPFLSPALATPIAGIQGLTTGNLINAGFAYQAAKNIPNVVSSVKTAYNDPTLNNITNATAQTALTALDAFPFAHGIAGEVKNKVLKGAKKVDDFLYDNVYGPSTVENIKPKNLQRELGKPIPINTGGNNLEVFNMKRFPNYLVKVEDPRRGELIFQNGYKDLDLVDLMKDVKDENIGKIVKQFKISPAQQALITNRVKGVAPYMLDPIDFRKIKDQSYIDLFNRVKEVRNKGLGYDFYGDNYHYIKDDKTFGIFDINPVASDKNMFWKGNVQGNMDLKSYSPEESAKNISQALADKIKNDYSRSLDNYFTNYYNHFDLGDGTYLGTDKIGKLSKSRNAFDQKIDRILNSNNLDPYKKGGLLPKAQQGTINNPFSNVGKGGWEKHKLEPVKNTPIVEPFIKKEETPWYENLYNTFRDKVEKAFPTGSVNLGGAGFSPEGAKESMKPLAEWTLGLKGGIERKIEQIQEEDERSIIKPKPIEKPLSVKKDEPIRKFGYKEIATVPDVKNPKDSLVSFTNTFDNEIGGNYFIGNKIKEVTDAKAKGQYNNVYGVAHFLRDSDILPNQKIVPESWNTIRGYKFHTTSPGKTVSATNLNNPDWYKMLYKKGEDGKYNIKYIKNKDITKENSEGWEKDFTVSQQHKFSDIDWDGKGKSTGYASKSYWLPLKNGNKTYIPYKNKDGFSRFSGGSGVYLFKDPKTGKQIGVDVSGSVNQLKNEGLNILKEYGIKPQELDFVYHDMGSYSAKPKSHNGTLNYNQWKDYNTYNKGFSGAPIMIPKFKNGGTIKDMNKLPKAQMGNLYETPDYFGVKQMLKPKKKFPVFQPDNTYLTSNKVPLNEARPENEQEVQWHPDWVEDENNPGHEIPREEKVYKNDDIKSEAPVSEELPTMENKRRFGEINYNNLQWLMPINTGLRILSNKYAEKQQDAYKKRNNVLNTQAVAPNFYGYDTVTGHDYTNNYSQFAKKGGIKKYNDGGLALLRSYIEDYIYEDDAKDTKRVTTKDVNNAEAEQKAKAERRAFFQQRRLREYQNEEDFLSSLFAQKDENNQRSSRGEFQSFSSPEEGRKALVNQLNLYQTGRTKNNVKPNSTLLQAMSVYAPASNNNDPQGYANFIGKKLGVSVDTPIKDLDPNKWADAITIMENNKFGNNPGNLKKTRKYLKGGTYFVSEEELSDMKKQGIKFKEI